MDSRQSLITALLPVACPVVVVLVLRTLAAGAGPQSAIAAAAPTKPDAVSAMASAPSPGQVEAARVIEVGLPSPFILPEAPAVAVQGPVAVEHPATPRPLPRAEFRLTAIIGGRETMAVINGKVRRVGEEPAPDWKVEGIDADAGKVTLRHAELGSLAVSLRPESGGR